MKDTLEDDVEELQTDSTRVINRIVEMEEKLLDGFYNLDSEIREENSNEMDRCRVMLDDASRFLKRLENYDFDLIIKLDK